jgi:hypothetical protein
MKKLLGWPTASLILVGFAILLFAAPIRFEGSVLVPISPGHGLSLLDSIALIPLLTGVFWLYGGLFQRRNRLYESIRLSPGVTTLVMLLGGLGLGFLLASAFSTFWWWWALGAILFGTVTLTAVMTAARNSEISRP